MRGVVGRGVRDAVGRCGRAGEGGSDDGIYRYARPRSVTKPVRRPNDGYAYYSREGVIKMA